MRILFLGAGATGGYYGGRLAAAGEDVTFLVRPKRAAELVERGLVIESPRGSLSIPVKTVTADTLSGVYDVIVLSCKAYDLDSAIDAVRPAVGPDTLILPLLNGLRHLDVLDAEFGAGRVLGGTCHISVTLGPSGEIRHFSAYDILTQGPRFPEQEKRCTEIYRALRRARVHTRLASNVIRAMWEKWVLLATLAGMTCLKRASIGEIVRMPGGRAMIVGMVDECCRIASAAGYPPRLYVRFVTRWVLTQRNSQLSSSMRRDLEAGRRIEADHIIGDLKRRADALGVHVPLLSSVYVYLQAYQQLPAGGQRHPSEANRQVDK